MAELAVIVVVLSSAIAVGITGLAAAWAEKNIGSAAVGAMAEKEELFGKGLVLTVIPETIVIFGLTVALVLLFVVLPQVL
ncbi:MAG: V-type ATP synthase subunit K [Candidatus Methanofastidiosum methylothiophilum]|uniref:V-type ATP synthase subunit K n=1 Tax=Candidatus Methanofastidiosum methylothiophilum TaxID=1705564 RepID=A0A150J7B1_9EURY|nr:MAG: V-type ATP synthase subunit K [Candidatus Methanofastidiosum methylthiophilus]